MPSDPHHEDLEGPNLASHASKGNNPSYGRNQNGLDLRRFPEGQKHALAIEQNIAAIANNISSGFSLHGQPLGQPWYANGYYYFPTGLGPTQPVNDALSQEWVGYLNQARYNGGWLPPFVESPVTASWPSSRITSTASELPNLVSPRRDSTSSNEHDIPATPYTHYHGFPNGLAVVDNSPHSLGPHWSTPSTGQSGYGMGKANQSPVPREFLDLLHKHPAIPRAVPAPCSPPKKLASSLENQRGVTNVYVRGLQPDTTDNKLHAYGSRFGEIESSKAIIDYSTGLCKGYGFIKYYNFKNAENCIRGFHYLGYETSFARDSFYSQLKKLSDEKNTNLYISNLPKDMNEAELAAIFPPFKCCSSRILRDSMGNGRGVGFARFHDRATCEAVIKQYYNVMVESKDSREKYQIQIRYADTQDQKSLKQSTAAARQYRSAEYESQTRHLNAGSTPGVQAGFSTTGDFETYMSEGGILQPCANGNVESGGDHVARDSEKRASVHFTGDPPAKSSAKGSKSVSTTVSVPNESDGEGVPLNSRANKENKVSADTLQQHLIDSVVSSASGNS